MKTITLIFFFITSITPLFGQESSNLPLDSNTCLHGQVFEYYKNGTPKSFQTYEHGFVYGAYETYYKNGTRKEKGFRDKANLGGKSSMVSYDKKGQVKDSVVAEITPLAAVPGGKCSCMDGNVKRLKVLLVGDWNRNEMTSFRKSDETIDTVFNNYETELWFFEDDRFILVNDSVGRNGTYELTSNKLKLKLINDEGEYESFMSYRWPKNTLYPNRENEFFNLVLFELLHVKTKEGEVKLNMVSVNFRKW